jgi:thioredoxin-like negative regulator of GroEL
MTPDLTIVCFCAAWCRTCDDYTKVVQQLKNHFGDRVNLQWLDIEDESDTVGDVDIENFPTLLISTPTQVHFFGAVLPFENTAKQLIDRALQAQLAPITAQDVLALNQRVHASL